MINFRGEACNDDRIGGVRRSRHTARSSGGEALLVAVDGGRPHRNLALSPSARALLGTTRLIRAGRLALIDLLLQPGLDGLPAVAHVTTNPGSRLGRHPCTASDTTCVNRDAQHLRDLRKRHQSFTGLECHDHPFSVPGASKQVFVSPKSRCLQRAIISAGLATGADG